MSKRIFVLFGTRPEAIKLFPVVKELQAHSAAEAIVCVTAQHREMLDQVLKLVNIIPDIDLDLMEKNQSLDKLSARILLLSLIHISEPTRRTPISYAVFCLK